MEIADHHPRWNTEAPAQGYAQVREVAADARTALINFDCGDRVITGAWQIAYVVA